MFYKYKKYFLALILLTIITLIISIFIGKERPTPILLSSIPQAGSVDINLDQTIFALFDIPVDSSKLTITSTPQEQWTIENLSPNKIKISHKYYFAPYTDYKLNIYDGTSLLGMVSFTTIKLQGDPSIVQTIEEQMVLDYPLATYTPLDLPSFKVVYSAPMTLEITIKNPNLTSQEIIDEVKSWVTKNGGDAQAHKYVVATPKP